MRKTKQLVKNKCANYFRDMGFAKDYCCLEQYKGCKCTYFLDIESRCGYFEQSVLPIDREYEIIYHAQRKDKDKKLSNDDKERLINANKVRIKCSECGEIVYANSNRQKYCTRCKKKVRRQQKREWAKENMS